MNSLIPEVCGIAVALSIDAMVVSCCWSATRRRVTAGDVLKFAVVFGLFQALMPVGGWLAGAAFSSVINAWDHWAAFGLLAIVAANMFKEGFSSENKEDDALKSGDGARDSDISLLTLLTLAVATSLDALAVGFSFALADYPIVWPAALIGIICFALTAAAVLLGRTLSEKAARHGGRLSIFGGLILLAIGVKILIEHGVFA